MDLNIDNYKNEELFNILDINIKSLENNDLNYDFLYNKLQTKIDNLKNIEIDELNEISENKAQLVDFFYQCFIKINNLIQEKQKNNVIIQDNHNIIKHNENKKEEYYPVNYKSGILNPLTIKTFKKVININTRFRENYETTFSSDFVINLPDTLKKVLSMQVINYQLPNTVYTVSSKLGSNCFYINDKLIMLTNGSYDADAIIEEINFRLEECQCKVKIDFNSTNGKMYFTSLDDCSFNLNFDYFENLDMYYNLANNVNKNQLTLGWLLGFRGNCIIKNGKNIKINYVGQNYYEAESIYDNIGNNYFLLSINDYQNNHNTTFISPFKYQSLTDNNILSKISSGCCNNHKILYPKRIYFGPTNINKLHIKIYDEFGRIIDINNADLSIELECEILYDL